MSRKGDHKKVKQIFEYTNQENLTCGQMGVKNNDCKKGKNPTLVDTNSGHEGSSPLLEAAWNGHTPICEYLLTQKANVEARNDNLNTALIYAAYNNHVDVIKVLLEHNASIKAQAKDGFHAAFLASRKGNLEVLKILLQNDDDVIDLKGWKGMTNLMIALESRQFDICKFLCTEKNPDVNLQDDEGRTALFFASKNNAVQIVEVLLNNGVMDFRNKDGKSALDIARELNNKKIVMKLEKHFTIEV